MNEYMEVAKQAAVNGVANKEGGPFGAVIVSKQGQIISQGNNKVLKNNDPTAHAEVIAIREACQELGTHDLSDYILYTTCQPCPMCLSAIIWSNIKEIYYGLTKEDAEKIGFRDNMIYEYLEGKNSELIKEHKLDKKELEEIFENYKKENGIIY